MDRHYLDPMLLVAGCQISTASEPSSANPMKQVELDSTVQRQVADYPLGPIEAQPVKPDFRFGCNSIYEDRKGRLWFGFAGGLYRLDGETFVNVTRGGPWD